MHTRPDISGRKHQVWVVRAPLLLLRMGAVNLDDLSGPIHEATAAIRCP